MYIQLKAAIFVGAKGRSQAIRQLFKPMETIYFSVARIPSANDSVINGTVARPYENYLHMDNFWLNCLSENNS